MSGLRFIPRISSFPTQFHTRNFSSAAAKLKSKPAIPLIDISQSFKSSSGLLAVSKSMDDAARSIGFFAITGHQIDRKLISRMNQVTSQYFDLPTAEKARIGMTDDYPYGYSGFGEENLRRGYSNEGAPDPKESFAIGPHNPLAGMPKQRWPQNPVEMQKIWSEYYQELEKLSTHIMRIFAVSLKLPENWFDAKIDKHRSALRALNYPAVDGTPAFIRAGAHTDYSSITLLLQDDIGGLQVLNRSKEWCDIEPVKDSFVINLGDLMSRWTNDEWVSTLHRVVNHGSNKRRQSIAFFQNINADELVTCIPSCTGPNKPPKYPPINSWDHVVAKHSASVKPAK